MEECKKRALSKFKCVFAQLNATVLLKYESTIIVYYIIIHVSYIPTKCSVILLFHNK